MDSNSTSKSSDGISSFLQEECGLCFRCVSLVIADHNTCTVTDGNDGQHCTVCFGLLSPSYQNEHILPLVKDSLLPYCQVDQSNGADADGEDGTQRLSLISADQGNQFMRESPTVNFPWVIAARAQCAIAAAKWFIRNEPDPSKMMGIRLRAAEEVHSRIKEKLRSSLRRIIAETLIVPEDAQELSEADKVVLPEEAQEEESGYLGIHVLILPPVGDSIEQLVPPSLQAHIENNRRQIQISHNRILYPRKRFRGNDPTLKQGGEPRANLELRVRRSGGGQKKLQGSNNVDGEEKRDAKRTRLEAGEESKESNDKEPTTDAASSPSSEVQEWNTMISWLEKNIVLEWLEKETSPAGRRNNTHSALSTWLLQLHQSSLKQQSALSGQCPIHVCSWRRPFYIQGTYTKSRRDISQTPFYVSAADVDKKSGAGNGHKNSNSQFVRKGISSVEEEVCPPISHVCGGISQENNVRPAKSNTVTKGADAECKGAVVYGMVKFHASGREDMDVRMLLPPPSIAEASAKEDFMITGRPFVCEVFDAHKMPSQKDLEDVVKAVNCQEGTAKNAAPCEESGANDIERDEKGWPETLVLQNRYHGKNSKGVGVSSPLTLAPSSAFSSLQSETEEKVKWYGCICWSSVPIASDEELVKKLACMPWDKEGEEESAESCIYPLEIHQSTPLRVLHRRSSDIRAKYILGLSARRIDDHWFRLRMSTSAGTYVKEFVHGDCGRTHPSIGSMLGGRTDITELDCEGIAV